jgi:dynein heavy chain
MGESSEPRVDFIQDFTLKSLRLKPDKWARMMVSDEQRTFIMGFIERPLPQELVISQNFSGHLAVHTDWPSVLKSKGVYFVKREQEPLPKENFLSTLTCGDIHPNALDHFCAWVEEIIAPILKLEKNLEKFPHCIADDIKRQVHELSTSVYQIRGYIKGRTLLPFPQQGAARIEEEEALARKSNGEDCNMTLKNNIEAIIIKWAYQTDEILSKDSAEQISVANPFPGPMTEINFWEAKCMNLESLYDQMKAPTTQKMASILHLTDRSVQFDVF